MVGPFEDPNNFKIWVIMAAILFLPSEYQIGIKIVKTK
jgi:hypothetical protein